MTLKAEIYLNRAAKSALCQAGKHSTPIAYQRGSGNNGKGMEGEEAPRECSQTVHQQFRPMTEKGI